jgi:hypothetical protein
MKKALVLAVLASFATLFTSSAALATFTLQVTEIWPGNIPGNNQTADWFEITNFGDTAWTTADGALFFDDDSLAAGDADPMLGISSIAPGESVIYVNGNAAAVTTWINLWDDVVSVPQVGSYPAGAGLGQGGDAVAIWVGGPAGAPYTSAAFPNANSFGGQSWDPMLGAFSVPGNAAGAVATLGLNNMGQPSIGSPGSVVPEPASVTLAAMGGLGVAVAAYRRRRAK